MSFERLVYIQNKGVFKIIVKQFDDGRITCVTDNL